MTSVFPNTPFLRGFFRIKFTIVGICFLQMLTIAQQQDPPPCDKYMDKRACDIVRSYKLRFAAEQNISVPNNDVSCCLGHNQLVDYPMALALDRQMKSKRNKRGAAIKFGTDANRKWSMPVNYYFSLSSNYSDKIKSMFRSAINHITNETCITFNELSTPSQTTPFMNVTEGPVCLTYSGQAQSVNTDVTVSASCLYYFGDALNVVAQSLGLLLEHKRPDRDSYINIFYANTFPSRVADFSPNLIGFTDYYNSPYDFSSVMHPPPKWLAQAGMITIQTKNPLYKNTIGQRAQFSFYDTQILNAIYCSAACNVPAPACQNGGYQDPRSCSKCKCPDGFAGDLCDKLMSHDTSQCGQQNIALSAGGGGVITSPGYDKKINYTTPISCTWLINAPVDYTITLAFLDGFNVTCINMACYHWVEIRYISNSLNSTGPRFCCDTNPGVNLTSTGNQVLVLFRAVIPADSARGFQLLYSAPTCPFWDVSMNANSGGASQAPGISTLSDCKLNCVNNPSCVAIDFDHSINPPACWIHTSSSDLLSTGFSPNCDQYRLKQRCLTAVSSTLTQPPATSLSSTMPSPAISPGCINWITNVNTNSYGASQNPSISTLDGCKQYCAATPSCAGIDFDHSGPISTCWIHTSPNDFQSPGFSPNVDQYILIRSCTSNTLPATITPTTTSTTTVPTTPTSTTPTSTTPTSTTQSTTPTPTSTTTVAPTCPYWDLTINTNSGGGSQAPGISSLEECKRNCDANPSCVAIDFDHSTSQSSCWIHTNATVQLTGSFLNCDQYKLVKRCQTVTPVAPSTSTTTMTSTSTSTTTPTTTTTTTTPTTTSTTTSPTTQTTSSTVCSTKWNVTEGLHSGNGVKVPGVQTESDCRNYCINMPSCEGVDFVWGASPQECWVHTNFHDFDTLYSDSNVRQIRITNRCTPPTCQTNWITRYGIHSIGAQRVTTDSMVSTSDCLEYCSNNDNCYGVDVDMSASPSPACWVHTNLNDFSALYSDSNVNQYQLSNRCPPTNVTACQNGWVIRNGTHSMGGVKTANPLMTFDCLAYCAANPTCIGVDTNPSKNPPECWVYTDATKLVQKYQDGNMVQYELIARCPNNTLPQNTGGCGGSAATPGQMHPPCMIPRVPASSCDIYNLRLVFMGSAWSLTYIMTHGPCMVPTCNGVTQLINLNGELKCAVQGWTSWTPCSRSCGCGVQYRYYYSVFNNMYSTTQQNQQNCNCQRC